MATRKLNRSDRAPAFILIGLFSMATGVTAKMTTFEREYPHQAGDYDTNVSCRALTIEYLPRALGGKR
jgi:hypothetical protein